MAGPGIEAVQLALPQIKRDHPVDLVIAQAENVTDGRGMSKADFKRLQGLGIDFFTGGNWTPYQADLHEYLQDPQQPVIGPANMPGSPGKGWKYVQTKHGPVLVVSLLGKIVGKDADKPADNPLKTIDAILEENKEIPKAAVVVNFHGDYSSEKRVIGYYLDGRAALVVGDHWHVPTADARVLPQGTAHITDVGMCGTLHSSLGVKLETIIPRWRDGTVNKNEIEQDGPLQFNAVLAEADPATGLSISVELIQLVME
jgi:metallophosphoesterase (TIGR00282 family)